MLLIVRIASATDWRERIMLRCWATSPMRASIFLTCSTIRASSSSCFSIDCCKLCSCASQSLRRRRHSSALPSSVAAIFLARSFQRDSASSKLAWRVFRACPSLRTRSRRTLDRAAACCVSRSAELMMASWFSTLLTARSTDDVMLVDILRIRLMTTPCK